MCKSIRQAHAASDWKNRPYSDAQMRRCGDAHLERTRPEALEDTEQQQQRPRSKVYVLGGFGGAAGLDIARHLFAEGSGLYAAHTEAEEEDNGGDHTDLAFCLDSHPGMSNHCTKEDCEAPLAAGLQRAAQHHRSLSTGTPPLITIVACNTMHLALASAQIPKQHVELVRLPEAAAASLNEAIALDEPPPKIVLWSTMATVAGGLYHEAVRAHGLALEAPPQEEMETVERIINLLKRGSTEAAIALAAPLLKQHAAEGSVVLLGCTELPLLVPALHSVPELKSLRLVDCNQAVAKAALERVRIADGL